MNVILACHIVVSSNPINFINTVHSLHQQPADSRKNAHWQSWITDLSNPLTRGIIYYCRHFWKPPHNHSIPMRTCRGATNSVQWLAQSQTNTRYVHGLAHSQPLHVYMLDGVGILIMTFIHIWTITIVFMGEMFVPILWTDDLCSSQLHMEELSGKLVTNITIEKRTQTNGRQRSWSGCCEWCHGGHAASRRLANQISRFFYIEISKLNGFLHDQAVMWQAKTTSFSWKEEILGLDIVSQIVP